MPRPFRKRQIRQCRNIFFKPGGIRMVDLEQIKINADEYEALRLADLENLSQEDSGKKMGISRQTFGRIIESARKKAADALINGKAIIISEEGPVELRKIFYKCRECGDNWKGTYEENICPECGHNTEIK